MARLGPGRAPSAAQGDNVYPMMAQWNKAARAHEGYPLTPRELEILALLASGMSTPEIADRLGIKPPTVKTHLTSIYRKTGAQNRVQAARHYLDHLALASES